MNKLVIPVMSASILFWQESLCLCQYRRRAPHTTIAGNIDEMDKTVDFTINGPVGVSGFD